MSVVLIGCGVAGILVCLELANLQLPLSLTIVDPYFDGGSLSRSWSGVQSNTTWEQIVQTVSKYPSCQKPIQILSKSYSATDRVLLADLGWLLQESIRPLLAEFDLKLDVCQKLVQTEKGWAIHLKKEVLQASKVILCQGGCPKQIDVGRPQLSLEIALDAVRVGRQIRKGQTVVVFGLQHSGTIVCKNLLAAGAKVIGVYKGSSPFLFARDGHYDGIKQESAELADSFLNSPPEGFELVEYQDTSKLIKAVTKAAWIVSAIGFETSPIQLYGKDGQLLPFEQYTAETGELQENLYGFGLAYPGITVIEGKSYKDVSIPSFVAQISRCLPTLLSKS